MRIKQEKGEKGSLKWVQEVINISSGVINKEIISKFNLNIQKIEWVSPIKSDGYAEYRDDCFLKKLGLEENVRTLRKFWPQRGPQWDALGKEENHYFILEAKANIPEINSNMQAKSEESIVQIRRGLQETREYLNCNNARNWEQGFYQYANRIAHLYFLRYSCNVDAYLVFLYFLNDYTHIPTSRLEWGGALKLQKQLMSLKTHKLQRYITSVYIDVNDMKMFFSYNYKESLQAGRKRERLLPNDGLWERSPTPILPSEQRFFDSPCFIDPSDLCRARGLPNKIRSVS